MERPLRRVLIAAIALAFGSLLALPVSAQTPGGRGRGWRMGGMMSHAALLRQEAVQAELGLSADLKSKIASELPQRGGWSGNPRDMTDDERQKWMQERRARQAEDDKKVAGLLDAKQLGRLKEIRIQALGAGALMDETVAKELGITDDQVSKLQAAMQSMRGQGGGDPSEMRRTMYTKALEMLSAEQKTKLETLRGVPFDTSKLQMRGPGGGGRAL